MRLVIWRCKHPSSLFLWPARTSESLLSPVRQLTTSSSRSPGAGSFHGLNSKENPDVANTTSHAVARSNAQLGKSDLRRARRRIITTLDPNHLDPGCFLDISGVTQPLISISFPDQDHLETFQPIYEHGTFPSRHRYVHPFPAGTHGFLYFHANPQSPLHSQLRFRVTEDSDPSSFCRGHDLVYDKGYMWYLPVAALASTTSQSPLSGLLVHDGLIDTRTISALQNLKLLHPNRIRRPISSLRESFALDMSVINPNIVVQAAGQDYPFKFRPPSLAYISQGILTGLYDEGSILCRFERSTLPEHAGKRIIVMRLLKILAPPKLVSNPPSTANTTLPAEGELFVKFGRAWCRDLDWDTKMARALRVLSDIDDGQEPGQP